MDRSVGVVAVGAVVSVAGRLAARLDTDGGDSIAVSIGVAIPDRADTPFVDLSVAVIVREIAHLGGSRVDFFVAVVAIGVVVDVAEGLVTPFGTHGPIAVTVPIGVLVPSAALVDLPVAVIVHAVAGVVDAGVNRGITVVTVVIVAGVAGGLIASLSSDGRIAVAVSV
jgi:hypothetical protein